MKLKTKTEAAVITDLYQLYLGDCLNVLRSLPSESIDSCVTDPPYGLEFMGSQWDSFKSTGAEVEKTRKSAGGYGKDSNTSENAYAAAQVRYGSFNKKLWTERPEKERRRAEGKNDYWDKPQPVYTAGVAYQTWCEAWAREVYRVLKPGGFLLAFGGSRTNHRLACGIEDAGFEIRDEIVNWLYGSGFPKSQDVGKDIARLEGDDCGWNGWGTALKPSHEPIIVARKSFKGTVARNVLKYGTGAINIDGTRIGRDENDIPGWHKSGAKGSKGYLQTDTYRIRDMSSEEIQERIGNKGRWPSNTIFSEEAAEELERQSFGSSRFFYVCKPSKKERDWGLDSLEEKLWVQWQTANGTSGKASSISEGRNTRRKNLHPTCKPIQLFRYLQRLVTPRGGVTLDPFAGSFTSGISSALEGLRYIGIEQGGQNNEYWIYRYRAIAAYRSLFAFFMEE